MNYQVDEMQELGISDVRFPLILDYWNHDGKIEIEQGICQLAFCNSFVITFNK